METDSLVSTFRIDFLWLKIKVLVGVVSLVTREPLQITQLPLSFELSPSWCLKFNTKLIFTPGERLVVSHVVCTGVHWAIVPDCTHNLRPNTVLVIHICTSVIADSFGLPHRFYAFISDLGTDSTAYL